MAVVLTIPNAFVAWRHFNHSDNAGTGSNLSRLWRTTPETELMVNQATRWPGDQGLFSPRGSPWTLTLDVRGPNPGQNALHILDIYDPGPPVDHQSQYQDGAELAEMTSLAWRVRWECPWQGSGSADYNDVYTYLWVVAPAGTGQGWTVGHIGVFPATEELEL